MNKIDFLQILHQELAENNVSDRADILYDYEEHFRIGEEKGKTETELIAELGDPGNIAKQYYTPIEIQEKVMEKGVLLTKNALPGTNTDGTCNRSSATAIKIDANASPITINTKVPNNSSNPSVKQQPIIAPFIVASALLLFNLIFIVGPYVGLVGTIIGLFAAAFGLTIGGLAMAFGFLLAPFFPEYINLMDSFSTVTMLSFGVGTTALGLLFIIGMCYLTKYFWLATKKYIKWNMKVIKG